jgi:transcriptional regulator with XRE-family HTH domain
MSTADSTTRKVAKALRSIRLDKGLTQAQVAEKAKINSNYYAKVERGEMKPSVEVYKRIARALKVTSSEIFPF